MVLIYIIIMSYSSVSAVGLIYINVIAANSYIGAQFESRSIALRPCGPLYLGIYIKQMVSMVSIILTLACLLL